MFILDLFQTKFDVYFRQETYMFESIEGQKNMLKNV